MVVFFPERVEVIGTQPGLEEESKVGKEPEWESTDLRRIFLPLFGSFTMFQDLFLRYCLICVSRRRKVGSRLLGIKEDTSRKS